MPDAEFLFEFVYFFRGVFLFLCIRWRRNSVWEIPLMLFEVDNSTTESMVHKDEILNGLKLKRLRYEKLQAKILKFGIGRRNWHANHILS